MSLLIKIRMKSVIREIIKGNIAKALQKLNQMNQNQYEVLYYKGICYFDLNDFESAQIYFESAFNIDSGQPDLAILLAQAYLLQNNSKKSLDILQQYSANPEAAHFVKIIKYGQISINKYIQKTDLIGKAMNYLRDSDYVKSIEFFKNALDYINDKEEKAKLYNQIGGIYLNYIKDIDSVKAKEYFQQAIGLSPQVKVYKRNLARAQNI